MFTYNFLPVQIQFWEQGQREATLREWEVSAKDASEGRLGETYTARVDHLLPLTNLYVTVAIMNNFYVSRPSDRIAITTEPGCEFVG